MIPFNGTCLGASEAGGSSCGSLDGWGMTKPVLSPVNMMECRTIRTLSFMERQRRVIESTMLLDVNVYSPEYN